MSACSVCGSTDLRPHLRVAGDAGPAGLIPTTDRYGVALADIARCARCGHMQLDPLPHRESLEGAYAETASEDYVAEEAGQRRTAADLLGRIEAHGPRGRLLDVGCWVGFLLAEARDRGWRVTGVEPSEFASRFARERLGLEVETAGLFDAELPERRFDAAVIADVIEHLPDPGAALDRITESLVPGGLVALTLPDAGSVVARVLGRRWWSVTPTHVQYFTRQSLWALLARHGFRIEAIETAPKAFTVAYYLGRTGGYSPALARVLVGAAERLGMAERLWAPDFRDRMLVLARSGRNG